MAEGLINHLGKDDFQAFSAGSKPTGYVHPMSLKTLKKSGIFLKNTALATYKISQFLSLFENLKNSGVKLQASKCI